MTHEPQPRPVAMAGRVGKEGALSASAGSALSMVQKTASRIDLLENFLSVLFEEGSLEDNGDQMSGLTKRGKRQAS